jgi:hypothetical protein
MLLGWAAMGVAQRPLHPPAQKHGTAHGGARKEQCIARAKRRCSGFGLSSLTSTPIRLLESFTALTTASLPNLNGSGANLVAMMPLGLPEAE